MSKRRYAVAVLLILSTLFTSAAVTANGEGAVCPHGNVKWETDSGYEYTDGSATVTGDENSVSWQAADGYVIVSVCIKIGGPKGGSLIDGLAQGGGPFEYGISHVVITTERDDDNGNGNGHENGKENGVKICPTCGPPLREVIPLGYEGMKIWYNDVGCGPDCEPIDSRIHIIYRNIQFYVHFMDGSPPLLAEETRTVGDDTFYIVDIPSRFFAYVTDLEGEPIGWQAYNYIACSVWPADWSFTETDEGLLAIVSRGQWASDWIERMREDFEDSFDSNEEVFDWVGQLFQEGQLLVP